jgi:hypothetical protein
VNTLVPHFSHQEMLDHAWRYFELHANQRMSLFNFFLVLSSFVAAGLGASLQLRGTLELMGVGLGVTLTTVSFTFWKLDQRTSFLIKHAERAVAEIESGFSLSTARLFSSEARVTARVVSSCYNPCRLWTYGSAFRFVFFVMGLVGIIGAILSVYFYFHGSNPHLEV